MVAVNLEQVADMYGISGALRFEIGPGGLPMAVVETALCQGKIGLHGGHVLSYVPADQPETLFVSPHAVFEYGVPVRGGIPVCWPWFGAHDDSGVYSHGFARRMMWQVNGSAIQSNGDVQVQMGCEGTAEIGWHRPFKAVLTVTMGACLEVELISENVSDDTVAISNALHSYFAVSDVASVRLKGLDGVAYIDDVDGGQMKRQQGDVTISGEVDRIYQNAPSVSVLEDPGLGRQLEISREGSDVVVVWNPHAVLSREMADMGPDVYKKMLCVEAVNVLADSPVLAPGGSHRLVQRVRSVPWRTPRPAVK